MLEASSDSSSVVLCFVPRFPAQDDVGENDADALPAGSFSDLTSLEQYERSEVRWWFRDRAGISQRKKRHYVRDVGFPPVCESFSAVHII